MTIKPYINQVYFASEPSMWYIQKCQVYVPMQYYISYKSKVNSIKLSCIHIDTPCKQSFREKGI